MPSITSLVVAPLYRLIYGPPLSGLDSPGRPRAGDGVTSQKLPPALAIVADGVGGFDICGTGLSYVMGAEGFCHAVEICRWGHGFGRWLADLTDVANRDAQALSIAQMVARFQNAQPEGQVFMVAKSGGAGVIVRALELLEQDAVERAVLLAPALSPKYDLSRALSAVRNEMVVFWSPLDVFILGLGTLVFGTTDRVRTRGAGLVGFVTPGEDDRAVDGGARFAVGEAAGATPSSGAPSGPGAIEIAQTRSASSRAYKKVRQIRWRPAMIATGYCGGHFGTDSPLFLKKYVLPLLRAEFRQEN
jgi:hypothetical protein